MRAYEEVRSFVVTALDPLFLEACRNERPERTPVWFMRQAGRSLPEYNAIRGTGSILDVVRHPDQVTEITLQPVRRYGVDAAVLYSDIMVPLAGMGFGVDIKPGVGPVVEQPFASEADLARLDGYDPDEHTPYVTEAVRLLTKELTIPLIGFSGGPFTLAAYLIEGGPSRSFSKTKTMMHTRPALWARLLDKLADICIASMRAQAEAGCNALQLFDSWAGALAVSDYERFVLPASSKVLIGIAGVGAIRVHFGTGTGELLSLMSQNADVVGVDWRVSLEVARARVGGKPIQGNLDPATCLASWDAVEIEVDRILREAGPAGHIFNLGHGVLPEMDPDLLKRLVDYVHGYQHD